MGTCVNFGSDSCRMPRKKYTVGKSMPAVQCDGTGIRIWLATCGARPSMKVAVPRPSRYQAVVKYGKLVSSRLSSVEGGG